MDQDSQAIPLDDTDRLLADFVSESYPPKTPEPRAQAIDKIRYTHDDMIDYILANPHVSQGTLAIRYGYTQAWISNIMASDAWKVRLAARREELIDPVLRMSIDERMRGLVYQSLEKLQVELERPSCSPAVMLKALELGSKNLGLGGHAPAPPPIDANERLNALGARLLLLQSTVRNRDEKVIEMLPSPVAG